MDVLEETRQLLVEQSNITTSKNLCDKISAWAQHVQSDVECLCSSSHQHAKEEGEEATRFQAYSK